MKQRKIEYRKTEELIPYINNPRINDDAVDKVAASIAEFGFNVPIVIDKDNVIITGHTRLKAAKKLKLDKVPTISADDLTKAQVKAFRIADNKVGELAEWDNDLLKIEFDELKELNFDLELTGFELDDIGDIFENDKQQQVTEDDYNEELPTEPKSKLGDIWQLGSHRLMCGDSTDIENINKLMNGEKADMIFTDPPYNVGYNGRSGKFDIIENDNIDEISFNNLITKMCNIIRFLTPDCYYIWCNWKFYGILQKQLEYKSCIVWAKNVFGMGVGYRHQHEFCLFNGTIDDKIKNESDLWEISKDKNYIHPTQKPVALSARALNNHKSAQNIIDLFGGSGSTLISCEQLQRNCFTMEIDPHYVDVIIDRWEKFTGKKAILLNPNEAHDKKDE